jgi:hypothetical protein
MPIRFSAKLDSKQAPDQRLAFGLELDKLSSSQPEKIQIPAANT